MTKRGLILDLDDTIADTACLAALRDARKWKECVAALPQTASFPGVVDALQHIKEAGISIGIVTASVSYYANRVLQHHGIPFDRLIAWHDCQPRKPHPAPVIKCLELMGCRVEGSLGLGDSQKDADAYRAAGLPAWGAGWSALLQRDANWTRIVDNPAEVLAFFRE